MQRLAALILMLMTLWAMSACNTVHGFGQDLEKAGEAISNAAKK
ncbi:entericidin A/B family lipoprotein [Aquabacterium olei]|uniref:Entericidin n=1 Tax=Aquabacterium olei TaxID=1296669 RepID=A0A2U8FSU4_9BURK|nr:entericidin A/B family lipoprotein [Aquabacterium olei]AWI54099.1 entericidin [Aquabacterium olei]